MPGFFQDLACSLRILRRHRLLTMAALFTLALAVGANTAVFSVVYGVLLRPLPFADVDRLVTVWESDPARAVEQQLTSPANFLDWQRQTTTLGAMAIAEPFGHTLLGEGEPEAIRSWLVSAGFFEILGTAPALGRVFDPDEYATGAAPTVILSHGLWTRRFGRDRNIVGRTLTLNGHATRVVGVMPPEFDYPPGRALWAPRSPRPRDPLVRGATYVHVVARLAANTTTEAARRELAVVASRLAVEHPETNTGIGISVVPLREHLIGSIRGPLLTLTAAVGLVLFVACANIAYLLLAHARGRYREFAVRRTLGATSWPLLRLILVEAVLLALAGAVVGVLTAYWLVDILLALGASELPQHAAIRVDGTALLFALALSAMTAAVVAVVVFTQARRASAVDLTRAHSDGRLGMTAGVAGSALLAVQVSLAFLVVVSAALLFRSYENVSRVPPGFSGDGLALEVQLARRAAPERAAFLRTTLDRVVALDSVTAAAATSALPFHPNQVTNPTLLEIEGRPTSAVSSDTADLISVTPRYFAALGVPFLEGRDFSDDDGADAPVAIVNQTLAQKYWPLGSPIDRTVALTASGGRVGLKVVGVVADTRSMSLEQSPRPEIYVPVASLVGYTGSVTYFIRTEGPPRASLQQVKDAIRSVNAVQTFSTVATLGELVKQSLAERELLLALFALLAALALTVAGVGMMSAVSYTTTQRTSEIGLRIAMGSTIGRVLGLMIAQALRPVAIGLALGLMMGLAATRAIAAQLYGISALDPVTFAAIGLVFLAVALVAAYLPARAAARLDPVSALRQA